MTAHVKSEMKVDRKFLKHGLNLKLSIILAFLKFIEYLMFGCKNLF